MTKIQKYAVVIGVIAGISTVSRASVHVYSSSGPNGTFAVSNSDLVNQGQPTFSSVALTSGTAMYGSSETNLNDGKIYSGSTLNDYGSTTETLAPLSGSVVVFTLNTILSPSGYDIRSIVSLTGDGEGQVRSGQDYTLAVSLVGQNGFTTIASVDTGPDAWETEVQVTVADDAGGWLATGVDQIQITFFDHGSDAQDMYREIDVFGQAIVPEPSSLILLALGGGLLWWQRRRLV